MNPRIWSLLNWLKHQNSAVAALSLLKRGALKDNGWFRSVRQNEPVDAAGEPIPWISYPALSFLQGRTNANLSVFEFGSGYSTLWWARRAKHVCSCEADPVWHGEIARRVPANVELFRVDEVHYPDVAARFPGVFDIVVIDGGDRQQCSESALLALNERGVILWDDTDRPEYRPGFDLLHKRGFAQLEFSGLGPIVNLTKSTSIFYRQQNVLGI